MFMPIDFVSSLRMVKFIVIFLERIFRKMMNFTSELKYLIEIIRFLLEGNCQNYVKLHFLSVF